MSEVSPNDVIGIVPGTGRRSIRRQDDGIPVLGLLPSVAPNVVEPDVNTTHGPTDCPPVDQEHARVALYASTADRQGPISIDNDLLFRAVP